MRTCLVLAAAVVLFGAVRTECLVVPQPIASECMPSPCARLSPGPVAAVADTASSPCPGENCRQTNAPCVGSNCRNILAPCVGGNCAQRTSFECTGPGCRQQQGPNCLFS